MASGFCHLCGRELSDQGKSFHHKNWPRDLELWVCMDCYRRKPRCRICDLPIGSASPNGACATCNETLHLCLTCGQPARGRYFEFNGLGPYCRDCVKDRAACDVCGAPLTDEQWQLSDGRVFCAYCQATIVFGPAEAMNLYEEMKAVVTKELDLRLNIPTGLALVDRNQLGNVIKQQRNQTGGDRDLDPKQTLGIYARRGMRRGIYIQTGLPRTLFLQVAAHEYAHAWQGENCPLLRDPLKHEGFAEWLAYHVMGYYGYTQGQERMLARQDVYGNGLRWTLEVEARDGIPGVLDACRRST